MNKSFFLEDYLAPSPDNVTIVKATRNHYPKGMLPLDSKLYIVVNRQILEAKTKKIKHFEDLEDFVDYIQMVEKEGAVVVSFSRRDFDALTAIMDPSNRLWGISEQVLGISLYKVHIHGTPSKHAPPKYLRKK